MSATEESTQRTARLGWIVLAGALALFVGQAVRSAEHKSIVSDAVSHYAFGEWLLGRPLGPKDPRLGWDGVGVASALNVTVARLRDALTPTLGAADDPATTRFGTIPSVRWARAPSIAIGALLLVGIWFVTRRMFGPTAAAGAALVCALEPNLIGHSRFIAADVPGTLAWFAGSVALVAWIRRPTPRRLVALGVALAIAPVVKSTNLVLYPLAAVAITAVWARRHVIAGAGLGTVARRGVVGGVAVALLFGALFVGALQLGYIGIDPARDDAAEQAKIPRLVTRDYGEPFWSARPFVPPTFTRSFARARAHNAIGHPGYLFGERRIDGWRHYFPVAIGLKTPIAILVLAALGLVVFGWRRPRAFVLLLVPALAFLGTLCLFVRVNIGVRHALPIYPVLVICAGVGLGGLVRLRGRARVVGAAAALGLLGWAGHQAVTIYPHHASYFNEFAGGSYDGWRCLLDSNVDWNQDRALAERWARAQSRPVAINPLEPTRGLVVIQATFLIGNEPVRAAASAWLREHHRPIARPSPSLFAFDIP